MSLLTSAATKFMVCGRCGRGPHALRFMGSPLSFFACIGAMNQIGTPLPALSPPGGERAGRGVVHGKRFTSAAERPFQACAGKSTRGRGRLEATRRRDNPDADQLAWVAGPCSPAWRAPAD